MKERTKIEKETTIINLTTTSDDSVLVNKPTTKNLVGALEEALLQMEKLQDLEKEKLIFYKQIARCNQEVRDKAKSSQRVLHDCISRLLEPTQEKLQHLQSDQKRSMY